MLHLEYQSRLVQSDPSLSEIERFNPLKPKNDIISLELMESIFLSVKFFCRKNLVFAYFLFNSVRSTVIFGEKILNLIWINFYFLLDLLTKFCENMQKFSKETTMAPFSDVSHR